MRVADYAWYLLLGGRTNSFTLELEGLDFCVTFCWWLVTKLSAVTPSNVAFVVAVRLLYLYHTCFEMCVAPDWANLL